MPERSTIELSTWTIARFLVLVLALVFAYVLRDILLVFLFAVVLASAMEPVIRWFQDRKLPRLLATIMIFLCVFGVFFLAIYLLIPALSNDLQGFTLNYPVFERQIFGAVSNIPFLDFIRENARELLTEPSQYISSVSGGVLTFTQSFIGGVFSLIILIVVSFYLAVRERGVEDFIRLVTPLRHEAYAVDLWLRSQRKMGQWLRAQLLLGALIGAAIYVGLTLLNVKYALVFAFVAAILELVPIVGPVLSAVPPTIIAFLQDPSLALIVIILFIIVQQIESHIVVPLVMKSSIGISPIVVVIALLVGAKLAGIIGLLLAVPMAAVIAEFLHDYDRKKRGSFST